MSTWILRQRSARRSAVCLVLVALPLATFMVLAVGKRNQAGAVSGAPTIHAVPSGDGESLYIAAGRLGQLAIPVYAHVTVLGPTSYERSHTMTYDPAEGEYSHTFEGVFSAAMTVEGSIDITTTITPTLGSSSYVRYYVSGTSPVDLHSTDGQVNLHISAGGVPTDTYVIIMPTNAPPGDPPPGHRLIGQAYAIRASGALTESLQPMALQIGYETTWLAGADPHTMSLFAWDGGRQQWLDLGGTPLFEWYYLSQTVRRFTTYALMATTTWRDTFDDISGLSERRDVRLAYGGKLELASGASSGWAVSVPITPTGDFSAWDQLSYGAVITGGTALTVSVLDGRTGEELLLDAADGASLAVIDPVAHPSLRLQVTLSADTPGETPSLEEWAISWLPTMARWRIYLPLLIKSAGEQASSPIPLSHIWERRGLKGGGEGQIGCGPATTPPIEWSPPVNISDNAGTSLSPALATDVTGTLHAVWYDNSSGNLDILYASKGPEQEDWSAPVNISSTLGSSYWPAIAVDGQGNVHVAWEDGSTGRDILYALKPAGGTDWTEPANISRSAGNARFVALAADATGNVHAVWNDDTPGNDEVYYTMRPQGGTTWTAPAVVASTPGTSWAPTIAVNGSNAVHVAWHDFTPGPTEIYYVTKPNPTAPWSSPVNVSLTTGASYFPALTVDSSGTVHMVWMDAIFADYEVPFEVLYARKPPGGEWTPYVNLSQGTGSAEMPTLAVGPKDALHVAWDTSADPRLLYVRRPAPEMGWTAPVTVTSISPGAQYPAPFITVGLTETVHLLWSDFGALSRDVFHSTAAPPPVPEDHVLVLDEEGFAVAGACVYQNGVPTVFTDDSGVYAPPALAVGDTLVALQLLAERPTVRDVHTTSDSEGINWAYRTYVTSMDVADDGSIHPHVVTQMGQQRLVVKKTNPLILYNLVVSIEWDATITYTRQVSQGLRLASDYLYDVSDGQFAFGHVTIYDDDRHWPDADVQLLARSNVRPYAFVGGITAGDKAWTIRVGRGWDRWADSEKPWNDRDGFRTLVHEFGHYALYLYDEYFEYTFDGQGNLTGVRPSSCTGPENRDEGTDATNASIMDWQYTTSELDMRDVPGLWNDDWCMRTAQWQLNNEESDWETVTRYYTDTTSPARWLFVTPADRGAVVPGPDSCPCQALPFPTVVVSNTGTDASSRHVTVLGPDCTRYPGALVALDPAGGSAIDQGFTDEAGEIIILGAAEGDEVRAMSLDGAFSGSILVTESAVYTLSLGWAGGVRAAGQSVNPYISLVPSSDGRTLYPSVQGVEPGGVLYALIAQPGSAAPQRTQLTYSAAAGAYTGTASFSEVSLGTGGLYVRGLGPQGQQVAVDSDFSLLEMDVDQVSDLYSADGNLQLHLDEGSLSDGEVYAVLMPSGAVPQPLPPGRRVVGNAYAVRFSGARATLERPGVLKLFYHPGLLAGGTDLHTLSIYRWAAGTLTWEPLGGELDEGQRSVAVAFDCIGIYALMAAEGPAQRVYLPLVMR
jgi:hypothetical protein